MIVSFSVSNFRSFSNEEIFSLVASNRSKGAHEDHCVPIPNSEEKVLRAGVLYGANGAGKSNLFKALQYLRGVALETRPKKSGTGRQFFWVGGADQPSGFDLQFIAGGNLFRFGIKIDEERIVEEWLSKVTDGNERTLYERLTDSSGKVTLDVSSWQDANEKIKALATVGGPENQSFLATVFANLSPADVGNELGDVINWFNHGLTLVAPEMFFKNLGAYLDQDSRFRDFAGSRLRAASTGVDRLEVLKNRVSKEELARATGLSQLHIDQMDENGFGQLPGPTAIVRDGEKYDLITIWATHQKHLAPLHEESDGTLRYLQLLPTLYEMQNRNMVLVVDEIERSLHPLLVHEFIQDFLKTCQGSSSQILFTTHESNLLDLNLLRRDEIWFAEKDQEGASHLYSLEDFKPREGDVRQHYLQGRYGAVPFLGDFDRLDLEKE